MPFKLKDLMIDVLPQAGVARCLGGTACPSPSIACFHPTYCAYPTYCAFPTYHPCTLNSLTACPHFSVLPCTFGTLPPLTGTCGFSGDPGPIYTQVDPAVLKEQLRSALAQVEEQEKAAEAASRPQSREDAAALEEKLQGALDEVRNLKKSLPARGKQ